MQSNLANSYAMLGRLERAMQIERDVYSGCLKFHGEDHGKTFIAGTNYTASLIKLERFEEAKVLLRKLTPVARRVLGDSNEFTLGMRRNYAQSLYKDPDATLDDHREAVTTLEDTERIARRVLGGAHPTTKQIETSLGKARAALRARETPSPR